MIAKLRFLIAVGLLVSVVACNEVENEEQAQVAQSLCIADFEVCVNPIFDGTLNGSVGLVTCSASGCHNQAAGSGGAFKIFANAQPGSTEMLANFFAAKSFANLDNPAQSKLLLEPLQGVSSISGTHTGGDIFPDSADLCYQAIFSWISTRVDDRNSSSCGVCTAVALASCGF
ncbi:MAG: hypothetical protein IIA05_06795 [Proteobacteria bacterium]|nr:hypothetical protein [Pseudomonadota bacterium]MCH9026805.1 hypothetical protein [Pseudomonadota bacterium]